MPLITMSKSGEEGGLRGWAFMLHLIHFVAQFCSSHFIYAGLQNIRIPHFGCNFLQFLSLIVGVTHKLNSRRVPPAHTLNLILDSGVWKSGLDGKSLWIFANLRWYEDCLLLWGMHGKILALAVQAPVREHMTQISTLFSPQDLYAVQVCQIQESTPSIYIYITPYT